MPVIYTYIRETNYVPREYSVAAILLLLFMVLILLLLLLLLLLLPRRCQTYSQFCPISCQWLCLPVAITRYT